MRRMMQRKTLREDRDGMKGLEEGERDGEEDK